MCIIIASPMGKRIEDDIIDDAAQINSHGAGIAWFEPEKKKILWLKGLDKDEVKTAVDKHAVGKPHVLHFRISTCGGVNDELTHPFSIDERASVETSGEADAVLFHNGMVGSWKELLFQSVIRSGIKVPDGPWSDTRAMAVLCHVYGRNVLSIIESGSRFLVMDATTIANERMFKWGSWHQYKEFSFSNQGTRAFYAPRAPEHRAPVTRFPGVHDHSTGIRSESTGKGNRRFKAPAGFEVWKRLKDDGLSLVADNETPVSESEVADIITAHSS